MGAVRGDVPGDLRISQDRDALRVEVLGPLRAFAGGREIDLGAPKQRAAFAVLAMRANTIVPRGELIDRVWGETAPTTAAGSLHTYASGLRRALTGLADALTSDSTGYLLRLKPDALDLARAESLASRARAARAMGAAAAAITALDEALSLWREGPPLGSLPGPFAAEQCARLDGMRLRLLVDRTELMVGTGLTVGTVRSADLAEAADRLEAEARAHPFDERLRSALMMALHRSGRTVDALAHYHSLRRVLADELGIEPESSTRAVHMAILAQDAGDPQRSQPGVTLRPVRQIAAADVVPDATPAPAPVAPTGGAHAAPPAQLPPDSASFVGRADELRQILEHARHGADAPRIVMLVGVAGVGKTTLGVRCGHLLREEYPDGQIYVNLRGFDPAQQALKPSTALHQMLSSLGITPIPAEYEQRVALWRSTVADRRLTLLLDNARSAEQVEDLLPGTGSCFVTITSRNRLGRIAVKYAARRVTLAPLAADDALRLLADAVGPERVHAEAGAARRLAQLCDHLPFALRIAAEQLVASTDCRITDLVRHLEDVHQRLDTLQLDNDDLCSVRSVMSWSLDALDPDTARAFRLLGAFPGVGVTKHCAAELFDTTAPAADRLMRRLSAQHLLEQRGDRYTMHDLTRAYARELAFGLRDTDLRAARDRVTAWYTATMAPMASGGAGLSAGLIVGAAPDPRHPPKRFAGQAEFLRWCVEEGPNLQALVRSTARSAAHRSTWQLTYLLSDYFYACGSAADWLDLLLIALRSVDALGDRRARAALLDHLGVAQSRAGRSDNAVASLRQGLDLLDGRDDQRLRVSLLAHLASALRETDDHGAALAAALEACGAARELDDGRGHGRAVAEDALCKLYVESGRWAAAVRHAERGLADARACGSVLLEASLLISLGRARKAMGDAATAKARFQEVAAEEDRDVLSFLKDLRHREAGRRRAA
jgi:DNA-binding SARP family transcriptional activator/tetratricopeptide (TPR) repeat protein